jgi:bifunctional non-homologous end joining protein LigD
VPAAKGKGTTVEVDGQTLSLSNLDKPLYPDGYTKGQVIHYYATVAPAILPHLAERPLTLIRYPNGVQAKGFFAKRCPPPCPDWLHTVTVDRQEEEPYPAVVAEDTATLVWLANLAAIELHVPLAQWPDWQHPTGAMFDLDPGPPAGVLEAGRTALHLRDLLGRLGLEAVVKTTGGKGLHVLVPLAGKDHMERVRAFASAVAELMLRERPDDIVTLQTKKIRGGKILVDWTQNHVTKTNVAAYSLRAKHGTPHASTPLAWDELEAAVDGGDAAALAFSPEATLARIEEHGDLWAGALAGGQRIPGVPDAG